MEGKTEEYYERGQLKIEWNYKKNMLEGISKKYYPNGKMSEEFNFDDDKLNGVSRVYYPHGGVARIDRYYNGRKLSSKRYDEVGRRIVD